MSPASGLGAVGAAGPGAIAAECLQRFRGVERQFRAAPARADKFPAAETVTGEHAVMTPLDDTLGGDNYAGLLGSRRTQMAKSYTVHAQWDEASRVWSTNGEDIPGLFCEASSFDQLLEIILDLAPDLLRANGAEPVGQVVDIRVVAERHGTACIAA